MNGPEIYNKQGCLLPRVIRSTKLEHVARVWTGHYFQTALCGRIGGPTAVTYTALGLQRSRRREGICKTCLRRARSQP